METNIFGQRFGGEELQRWVNEIAKSVSWSKKKVTD